MNVYNFCLSHFINCPERSEALRVTLILYYIDKQNCDTSINKITVRDDEMLRDGTPFPSYNDKIQNLLYTV